jgi:hypothetical protein
MMLKKIVLVLFIKSQLFVGPKFFYNGNKSVMKFLQYGKLGRRESIKGNTRGGE